MGSMASQITSLTIVYSTVYSGTDQRKYQISASLALVWGIHRWPVNSPHQWPVTRKLFPFDDVIMRFEMKFWKYGGEPGPLFAKWSDVLPPNLVKSGKPENVCYDYRIAMTFDNHFGSNDACQMSEQLENLNMIVAASRLHQVLRYEQLLI